MQCSLQDYLLAIKEDVYMKDFPELSQTKFLIDTDGISNATLVINNQQYRVRIETIVFNNKGKIYLQKQNKLNKYCTTYKLPGGVIEKGKSFDYQAAQECKEEAHIVVKNIKFTGLRYIQSYNKNYPEWQKIKLWPSGIKYEGSVTYIFVAEYDSEYNGYIAPVDQDDLYKYGKFYKPENINLKKEHKDAIDLYIKDSVKEEYIFTSSKFDFLNE